MSTDNWYQEQLKDLDFCHELIKQLSNDYDELFSDLEAARKDLELVKVQPRCDLIAGEPGHQKLLCDRLQAELDATQKENAIQAEMIERMVQLLDEFETIKCPHPKDYPCPLRAVPRDKNCVGCLKKYFHEQAEKEQAEKAREE